MMPYTYST